MKVGDSTIAIMMATYNGEDYLSQQIDSIISQTYKDWILFIHDDNSKDLTLEILSKYESKVENIYVIRDPEVIGGSSKKNFAAIHKWLTNNFDFNYFMFCDQDDVWLESKIEHSLKLIKESEELNMKPLLVHTDLKVVDEQLNVLGNSFFKYRALDSNITDINHLLIQNNITGCTMLWNKELNMLLNLHTSSVVMHDWWIALVASAFGKILFLNESTILYRQHGKNVVGATKVNTASFIFRRLLGNSRVREVLLQSFNQASSFLSVFGDRLTDKNQKIINTYISIPSKNKFQRVRLAIKYGFLKQGLIQIIGEFIFI
ncbi:glycosyltransferase family 2 protein [Streptococcus suis]|uniref:glycosyltransferase family 2 protein n=1 Tax=Streptococcus suis TaxID=1307 RepID=UPI0023D87130|nr:glycosyltransferase family 2 protein [Streptococcus suis]